MSGIYNVPDPVACSLKKFLAISIALGALLTAYIPAVQASDLFPEIAPAPEYEPDEVVGIQMRALGANNQPYENAGIELTFRFASPQNREFTGPLSRFRLLFDNIAYQPMVEHAELTIGEADIQGEQARVPVLIADQDGNQAGYLFFLSRQSEVPYENCWMTDRVIRVTLPDGNNTLL